MEKEGKDLLQASLLASEKQGRTTFKLLQFQFVPVFLVFMQMCEQNMLIVTFLVQLIVYTKCILRVVLFYAELKGTNPAVLSATLCIMTSCSRN